MVARTRRAFLKAAGSAAALALAGCGGSSPSKEDSLGGIEASPHGGFAGGVLLGALQFVGEANPRMETKVGSGLEGRLFTDHSILVPERMTIDVERYYIRTLPPDGLDTTAPWKIRVRGLVESESELALSELEPLVQPMGTFLMECAGNGRGEHFGLMGACEWAGIPLSAVLERTRPQAGATRLTISGIDHGSDSLFSTAGASWVFSPDDLSRAFLATQMGGRMLTLEHGYPVRLFIPGWYGCAAIKWVDELRWENEDVRPTPQMVEFAGRTHQDGVPELARDWRPARQAISATPIRVEKWSVGGRTLHRVVGVMWGGTRPTNALEIQLGDGQPFVPVEDCPLPNSTDTWTLWTHAWQPPRAGDYKISIRVNDPAQNTVRLEMGHYARTVRVTSV